MSRGAEIVRRYSLEVQDSVLQLLQSSIDIVGYGTPGFQLQVGLHVAQPFFNSFRHGDLMLLFDRALSVASCGPHKLCHWAPLVHNPGDFDVAASTRPGHKDGIDPRTALFCVTVNIACFCAAELLDVPFVDFFTFSGYECVNPVIDHFPVNLDLNNLGVDFRGRLLDGWKAILVFLTATYQLV